MMALRAKRYIGSCDHSGGAVDPGQLRVIRVFRGESSLRCRHHLMRREAGTRWPVECPLGEPRPTHLPLPLRAWVAKRTKVEDWGVGGGGDPQALATP